MSESNKRAAVGEMNLHRETWCQVETDSRAFLERKEMRHFGCHLRNSSQQTVPPQPRSAWMERPVTRKHVERKHYDENYNHKAHLV